MNTEIIEKIHNSDAFGIFVEMGYGIPISHELCKVEGASKTIFFAENPYSKTYSQDTYNFKTRAVSAETILQIYQTLKEKWGILGTVNTYVISSFQLGENTKNSTHGYIGIGYKDSFKIYHISINIHSNRSYNIELIGNDGLALLHNIIFPNDLHLKTSFVDIVYDVIENENTKIIKPNLWSTLQHFINGHESQLIYIENEIPHRVEDLLRKSENTLSIYKGSFNPIQNAHEEIANRSSKKPDTFSCLSISTNIVDKTSPSVKDLRWRVLMANKMNHGVLLSNSPYFSTMIKHLRNKTDKLLVFPMGMDTFLKINLLQIDDNYKNVTFLVFNRNNSVVCKVPKLQDLKIEIIDFNQVISSTEIRAMIENYEGEKDNLKCNLIKFIPEPIVNNVIDRYYWKGIP